MTIYNYPLKPEQYYHAIHPKKQIILHHTVSNGNAKNVIDWWNKHPHRVATAFVIDHEGVIHRCFNEQKWAHHLGMKSAKNQRLNQQSIGIELCSWGGLKKLNGRYYSAFGTEVSKDQVKEYAIPFRGYRYYQKYNDAQLKSLKQLLMDLTSRFNIPRAYHPEIWDLYAPATTGMPGIYTHVSYRHDKSDCHPQQELIQVLKSINSNQCKFM